MGTDIPDIVEIPLPIGSGINSSYTDIEIIDIKNISESSSTTSKEQESAQGPEDEIRGNKKGGKNSGIPDIQDITQKENFSSGSNGSFETISTDFESSIYMNKPESNRTSNKW